jgi:hypothetical protein
MSLPDFSSSPELHPTARDLLRCPKPELMFRCRLHATSSFLVLRGGRIKPSHIELELAKVVIDIFGEEYLRAPDAEETDCLLQVIHMALREWKIGIAQKSVRIGFAKTNKTDPKFKIWYLV